MVLDGWSETSAWSGDLAEMRRGGGLLPPLHFRKHSPPTWSRAFDFFTSALVEQLPIDKSLEACEVSVGSVDLLTHDLVAQGLNESSSGNVFLLLNIEGKYNGALVRELLPHIGKKDKVVIVGNWWNASIESFISEDVTSIWVPAGSLLFALRLESTPMDLLAGKRGSHVPPNRAALPNHVFNTVAYQQSFCTGFRERFWDRLNLQLRRQLNTSGAALGKCNGELGLGQNMSNEVYHGGHYDCDANVHRYGQFKSVLVAEHCSETCPRGYITEKIFDALLAGVVPIYYGPEKITEVVNGASFLYLHPGENDDEVVDQIVAGLSDPAKFVEMRQAPPVSADSLRRFFSWHPAVWPEHGDSMRKRIVSAIYRHC